jgi:hypothetical protein
LKGKNYNTSFPASDEREQATSSGDWKLLLITHLPEWWMSRSFCERFMSSATFSKVFAEISVGHALFHHPPMRKHIDGIPLYTLKPWFMLFQEARKSFWTILSRISIYDRRLCRCNLTSAKELGDFIRPHPIAPFGNLIATYSRIKDQ